jgi:glycosyltransferase involved in cell wall biosynthesis
VYAQTDLLIIPSLVHETFSLVAREALSAGKPVIASNVGALPEIIEHGENGFLFPAGDHHTLAGLLTKIAADPHMLSKLDLPGPNPILTVHEHVDALERMYAQVLPKD